MSANASTQKYGTILTVAGKTAIAEAMVNKTLIDVKYIAFGDGDGAEYYPAESQTGLKKQVYQIAANNVYVDEDNPAWIVIEGLIPETAGGFFIREAAIKTADGTTIAIGSYPTSYKPKLNEGSAIAIGFQFILEVTNASVVNLNIDPGTVYATLKDIEVRVSKHASETNAHGGTYSPTPNRLALRNAAGQTQVSDPEVDLDAANRRWTLESIATAIASAIASGGGSIMESRLMPAAPADGGRYLASGRHWHLIGLKPGEPFTWHDNGVTTIERTSGPPELWEASGDGVALNVEYDDFSGMWDRIDGELVLKAAVEDDAASIYFAVEDDGISLKGEIKWQ